MKTSISLLGILFTSLTSYCQFSEGIVDLNDTYFNTGQVGIGLTDPTSKLDLKLNSYFMYQDESALRITYPIPSLSGTGPLPVNENIFEIRQKNDIGSSYIPRFVVETNGNVGVGITDPTYKLHLVNSNMNGGTALRVDAINGHMRLFETDGSNPTTNYTQLERNADAFHIYQRNGSGFTHALTATSDGDIGIGTTDPEGYKLAVKGKMIAEEIVVKLYANWPDFVFTEKYGLMDLKEVEAYIDENSHLPNVPSSSEIEEGGINLGQMDAILLQKIEELTLYVIELKKENQSQQALIESLTSIETQQQ